MDRTFFKRLRTNDEFELWLSKMDEEIEYLIRTALIEENIKLDYSLESVSQLEKWLMEKYDSREAAYHEEGIRLLGAAGRYVGEIFRSLLGGEWVIDIDREDFAYLGYPGIENFRNDGTGVRIVYPCTWVTATIARRTHFATERFEHQLRKVQDG